MLLVAILYAVISVEHVHVHCRHEASTALSCQSNLQCGGHDLHFILCMRGVSCMCEDTVGLGYAALASSMILAEVQCWCGDEIVLMQHDGALA